MGLGFSSLSMDPTLKLPFFSSSRIYSSIKHTRKSIIVMLIGHDAIQRNQCCVDWAGINVVLIEQPCSFQNEGASCFAVTQLPSNSALPTSTTIYVQNTIVPVHYKVDRFFRPIYTKYFWNIYQTEKKKIYTGTKLPKSEKQNQALN